MKNINRWKFYSTTVAIIFTITMLFISYLEYYSLIEQIRNDNIIISYKHQKPHWLTSKLTMYNAGDPYQTDNSPCLSSSGDNICTMIAQGQNVCATNFLPEGTKLRIKDLGDCIVLDTMALKYSTRIDWALPADKKEEAIKWGIKTVEYIIIN